MQSVATRAGYLCQAHATFAVDQPIDSLFFFQIGHLADCISCPAISISPRHTVETRLWGVKHRPECSVGQRLEELIATAAEHPTSTGTRRPVTTGDHHRSFPDINSAASAPPSLPTGELASIQYPALSTEQLSACP